MAHYAYKAACYDIDQIKYKELVNRFEEEEGREHDGDSNYDGDNWYIMAMWINELRDKVAELESQASPASVPEGWKHSCNALCMDDVELWIPQCPHCGKPAPTPPVSEDRWQPIETAPKDGSKFLAWRRHSTIPLIVFYNAEYDQYECNDGLLVFSLTHWMPLPKAPSMEGKR